MPGQSPLFAQDHDIRPSGKAEAEHIIFTLWLGILSWVVRQDGGRPYLNRTQCLDYQQGA